MAYTPPAGHQLKFNFLGADNYAPPGATAVAFNFTGYPPYLAPPGDLVALNFTGSPYTPPEGHQVALEFAPGEIAPPDTQFLFPAGILASQYGDAHVRNQRDYVAPEGFDSFASGQAVAWRYHTYVSPNGIAPPAAGTPSVMNKDRHVAPGGFSAAAAGNPTIINRNRYIAAGNLTPPPVPSPSIWLYTRYLNVSGFNAALYGATVLTHGRRYIQMQAGIAAPPVGALWISQGTRMLSPAGILVDAVGMPVVGGTRYLEPSGWDSQAFGERIIPESQTIAPLGFREQWGDTDIKNWITYAQMQGFHSTGQEEFRYGWAQVWNQTQYIEQVYDPDDGLNPPPIVGWTEIENVNRSVGAFGITPPPPGIPQVDNNARLIQPSGFVPPDHAGTERRHMVAGAVRWLPLEGIEPPMLSGWAVVYNGAVALLATGNDVSLFGVATLENTRRYFDRIGAIEPPDAGVPMIADAIRHIAIEPRYAIEPPDVPLPEVKQYTRYINAGGDDHFRHGLPDLVVRWNIIAPKWATRDYVGEPRLFNVTPEVQVYGWNAEEFGDSFVRLQWRPLPVEGVSMQLFGLAKIADTRQVVGVPGANYMNVSTLAKVTKTGAPPYSPQNIIVENAASDGVIVGHPSLNQSVLRPEGIAPRPFGDAWVRLMGANIYAGIRQDEYGVPSVTLKNRELVVVEWEDVPQPSAARMSPHTIWAVKEAPPQAVANHPPRNLHYVGETIEYAAGERFGRQRISLRYERISPSSVGNTARYGQPAVFLGTNYIVPRGLQAYRMGWANVGDGTQFMEQFSPADFAAVGRPTVIRAPYVGPRTITLQGIPAPGVGAGTWASHYHRTLTMTGLSSLQMGGSRGDSPYQWQSLHVGPPMPTIPAGFDAQAIGVGWVSFRVRQIEVEGYDAFLCGYDPQRFNERLRVRNAFVPTPDSQGIVPQPIEAPGSGVPDVKPGTHYIRPDGNSDQFRKGALHA